VFTVCVCVGPLSSSSDDDDEDDDDSSEPGDEPSVDRAVRKHTNTLYALCHRCVWSQLQLLTH